MVSAGVSASVLDSISQYINQRIRQYQLVYQLVYQVTYHLAYQVTYRNTRRNVDVPELGSSRYIETRSPADRHQLITSSSSTFTCFTCSPDHLITCFTCFAISFTLSSSQPPLIKSTKYQQIVYIVDYYNTQYIIFKYCLICKDRIKSFFFKVICQVVILYS